MPTYRVVRTVVEDVYLEAEDPDSAVQKAIELDFWMYQNTDYDVEKEK